MSSASTQTLFLVFLKCVGVCFGGGHRAGLEGILSTEGFCSWSRPRPSPPLC